MTDLDLRAGQIHRGLGVVARWTDIALVIPSDSAHDANVDKMFHELGPAPTSPALVSAINAMLAESRLKSVAMLVEATGGPLAMAFGPVEVLVDGRQVLDGSNGGVRQQMPATAHRLTIRATNLSKAAEPVAPYDLRRGIAPGAGLTLVTISVAVPPAPANLQPAAPVPPPSAPTPPESPTGNGRQAPDRPAPAPVGVDPPTAPQARQDQEPRPAIAVDGAADRAVDGAADRAADGAADRAVDGAADSDLDSAVDGADHEAPAVDPSMEPTLNHPISAPVDREAEVPPGVRSGRFDQDDAVHAPAPVPQVERAKPAVDPSPISVPFRSVLLLGAEAPTDVTPLPLAEVPKTGELSRGELDAGRVEVQGILCSRRHFNNPGASNCMVCGLSMLHLTHNLVKGPRPTLGFIVFDDGSTFGLDRSYVIGREPAAREDSGDELLTLHENNETLSRTHAQLRLVDWTVQLVDLESTNGTYIWDQSFERWNQLAPGHPVELTTGDTIALGRRTLVFESVSRA